MVQTSFVVALVVCTFLVCALLAAFGLTQSLDVKPAQVVYFFNSYPNNKSTVSDKPPATTLSILQTSRPDGTRIQQPLRQIWNSDMAGGISLDPTRSLLIGASLEDMVVAKNDGKPKAVSLQVQVTNFSTSVGRSSVVYRPNLPLATAIGIDVASGSLLLRVGTEQSAALVEFFYTGSRAGEVVWRLATFPTIPKRSPPTSLHFSDQTGLIHRITNHRGTFYVTLAESGVAAIERDTGMIYPVWVSEAAFSCYIPGQADSDTDRIVNCLEWDVSDTHVILANNRQGVSAAGNTSLFDLLAIPVSDIGTHTVPEANVLLKGVKGYVRKLGVQQASGQHTDIALAVNVTGRLGSYISTTAKTNVFKLGRGGSATPGLGSLTDFGPFMRQIALSPGVIFT